MTVTEGSTPLSNLVNRLSGLLRHHKSRLLPKQWVKDPKYNIS
jgi:hypothetical protein